LLLAIALAGPLDDVHELEWTRAEVSAFTPFVAHEQAAVRAAAATALGRLRDPAAIDTIVGFAADDDPTVRAAAAEALGHIPTAGDAAVAWLERELATAGARRVREPVRPALLHAIGRQGDASHLAVLVQALSEPWPVAEAAAEAIARFGRRDVEDLEASRGPLVRCLARPDPRTVESCAYALGRTGLEDAPPALIEDARSAWRTLPTPRARAWLLKANHGAASPQARADVVRAGLADSARLVRTVALQTASEELTAGELLPFVDSSDSWVRSAALGALGRSGDAAGLDALAQRIEVWPTNSAAEAIDAWIVLGGTPDSTQLADERIAARAAYVAGLKDVAVLAGLLGPSTPSAIRTAAIATLSELPDWTTADMAATLTNADGVVRQGVLDALAKKPPVEAAPILAAHLASEEDGDALELTITGLTKLIEAGWMAPAELSEVATTLRTHPQARVRAGAAALLQAAGEPVASAAPASSELDRFERWDARVATVTTSRGVFRFMLRPDLAPAATANFAHLAGKGEFDDVVFHRVVPGFVIQTGDPRGDGWGGPGWVIPDEVSIEPYTAGAVGMARSGPDTAGSQWFVTTAAQPHLEGDYTLFGRVVDGMHVVRAIERGDTVKSVVIE
jgi:cyclophilin family peptidyl-prolyl cis-trans isomerase/HEAT repeat protein